jgi:hypothetical protein
MPAGDMGLDSGPSRGRTSRSGESRIRDRSRRRARDPEVHAEAGSSARAAGISRRRLLGGARGGARTRPGRTYLSLSLCVSKSDWLNRKYRSSAIGVDDPRGEPQCPPRIPRRMTRRLGSRCLSQLATRGEGRAFVECGVRDAEAPNCHALVFSIVGARAVTPTRAYER